MIRFCLDGLPISLAVPETIGTFKCLTGPLGVLRLLADLVRGAVYLLACVVPAVLITPDSSCPGLSAARRLAKISRERS